MHTQPETETQPRRCRHIFVAGRQCGSPCLRTEQFCYFHHTTRRPVADPRARLARTTTYDLPVPEDRDAIRVAISQVMHDIANNHIDLRRAGLILYSLQIALCALPKESAMSQRLPQHPSQHPSAQLVDLTAAAARPASRRKSAPISHIPAPPPLQELVQDETYGLIAPASFIEPAPDEEEDDEEEDIGDTLDKFGKPLRNSLAYKLLKEVELYEARQEGYERARRQLLDEGKLKPAQPRAGIDIDAAAAEAPVALEVLLPNEAPGVQRAATAPDAPARNTATPCAAEPSGAPHPDPEMWVSPAHRSPFPHRRLPRLRRRISVTPDIPANPHRYTRSRLVCLQSAFHEPLSSPALEDLLPLCDPDNRRPARRSRRVHPFNRRA